MAKVARLTDGTYNWVFFADGDTVKVTVTTDSRVYSREDHTLESGRELYRFVKKFNPRVQEGFSRLNRELTSIKLYSKEQIREYDKRVRASNEEESYTVWDDYQEGGYVEVFYSAGNRKDVLGF